MQRIQQNLDNIALLGLPALGRQWLADRLDLHAIDDPEIRYVCDHPDEIKGFPLDRLSTKLADCCGSGCPADQSRALVMIYGAPAEFLERQIASAAETMGSAPEDIETFAVGVLEFWRAYHLALLDQYRLREGTTLLINGDRSIVMETLLHKIEQSFGVRMTPLDGSHPPLNSVEAETWQESYAQVVEALAPECLDIYAELESCAELMGRQPEFEYGATGLRKSRTLDLLRLLAERIQIRGLLDRLGIDFHGLARQLAVQQEREKQLAQARDKQAKLSAESQAKVEVLTEEKETLQNESELLRRELQQVQEESEQHFLRQQKSEQQLAVQQEREKQLIQARDKQAKLSAESQAKVEVLTEEKQTLQNENELLLLQLHEVQKELEQYYLRHQESEQQLADLKKQGDARPAPLWQGFGESARRTVRALWGSGFKKKRRLKRQAKVLRESGAFDVQWYLAQYPDVAKACSDPVEHYLNYGTSEGKNPSAQFDTLAYLEINPDVAEAQMNPLLHYVNFGKQEGRQTHRC